MLIHVGCSSPFVRLAEHITSGGLRSECIRGRGIDGSGTIVVGAGGGGACALLIVVADSFKYFVVGYPDWCPLRRGFQGVGGVFIPGVLRLCPLRVAWGWPGLGWLCLMDGYGGIG